VVFKFRGKTHTKARPAGRAGLNGDTAVMYTHNLTNQSQPQAYPSKLPTSGFVYTKEWFKHPFLQFIRNSASGIFYGQTDIFSLPICGYSNLPTETIVFDRILNKIVYHPVNQNITSDHSDIFTVSNQFYFLFLGERFQIHQYLIDKISNGNGFIPSYRLKFTHIEQCLDHFAEPAVLFRNHLYRL